MTNERRRAGVRTAAALAIVFATSAIAAPTPAQRCEASKAKAAGAAVYGGARCYQKALADGATVDAACLTKAEGKLTSSYGKAEGKGGCEVTGDAGTTQDAIDACLADFTAAIGGDSKCSAAKMKATGRKAYSKSRCWQKGFLAGTGADSGCLADTETKFTTEIGKADTFGACTDTAPALEALVDDCLSTIIDETVETACPLDDNTTATTNVSPDGCAVLERDTSACDASRASDGLSGFWLEFSCRVTLSNGATAVTAQSDGQPDYFSNYFTSTHDCHEDYTGGIQNPNLIAVQNYTVSFPTTPNATPQTMMGQAVVGMSLNGVPIFGNFAAPGDNIFDEAATFDRCGAHPQMNGKYHYHSEPYAISYDDSNLVGVMRDGYPIYGRRDSNDTLPGDLDAQGGHTSVTPHSPVTPVYHYHVNEQVNPENAADSQWFITTGTFHGTPGAVCTGC